MNKPQITSEEIPSKLTEQQHNSIFKELESELLQRSRPNQMPSIVIVGGQAGAGKTSLKQHLCETVFANKTPAIIDSDSYRGAHPNFFKIIESDEKKLYAKTNEDVREWTSKLLDSALKNNRDIILEATLRNIDKTLKTIKKIKTEHPQYKIHVAVVSVNEEISRTGMMVRYTNEKLKQGFGRFVSVEAHDETYKSIPLTLRAVEEQSLIDSVIIVDRYNQEIYHHEAIDGIYTKPLQAQDGLSVLCKDRSQNIFTKQEYAERLNILLEGLEKLGADEKDYKVVFDALLQEPETTRYNRDFQQIYPAQHDRLYQGKIIATEKDKVLQEIASGVLVEHQSSAVKEIGQTDIGKVFSISYDGNGTVSVKQVSWSQERGVER